MNVLIATVGCLCLLPFLSADDKFFDLSLKDSAPVCVGKICDSSNAFFYYSCCGQVLNDCCFHLQQWVLITFVIIGILSVLSFAIGLIKCLCCCNDR